MFAQISKNNKVLFKTNDIVLYLKPFSTKTCNYNSYVIFLIFKVYNIAYIKSKKNTLSPKIFFFNTLIVEIE